jgi:hypothetical protein
MGRLAATGNPASRTADTAPANTKRHLRRGYGTGIAEISFYQVSRSDDLQGSGSTERLPTAPRKSATELTALVAVEEVLTPTDASDAEWSAAVYMIPVSAWMGGSGGRPEGYCHREMLDAVRYVADNGIKWRAPPKDFRVGRRCTGSSGAGATRACWRCGTTGCAGCAGPGRAVGRSGCMGAFPAWWE